MYIVGKRGGERIEPLERIELAEIGGADDQWIVARDGQGRVYARLPARAGAALLVGGALGEHTITLEDAGGATRETLIVPVRAETRIREEGRVFGDLLQMLSYTMITEVEGGAVRWRDRIYRYFVCWLRDHTHVMKGMKYFSPHLKDAVDLFRDSQRADGMIWDNVYPRTPLPNYWDVRFTAGDFIRPFEDYRAEFKRIPVENDVEYLFVEALYYTWKATGDDGWMFDSLDAACRALDYTLASPYRWSTTYGLLKRGYTIDTWDFQNAEDAAIGGNGDFMLIDPDKTRFGVMFGDNTGYMTACAYLAEMLDLAGRRDEAARYRQRGREIKERLDAVSWNGRFYRHWTPEDPSISRDLGVDEASQVSLSNSYSLNRGLTHEQCVAIITTYQDIRDHLPEGSPGEWYAIYPPFGKGYGSAAEIWQYVNGGVLTLVAGELAHGAFEHGYEAYGADILRRVSALGKEYGGVFHEAYTGAFPRPPERNFTPLDIAALANIDTSGVGAPGVPGWTGEGDNDLHEAPAGAQTLAGVPFAIPDPATNGRRAAIGLSAREGYARQVELPIGGTAGSLYLLHTVSGGGPGGVAGLITFHYADGGAFTQYVVRGQNVSGWWFPEAPNTGPRRLAEVAWRGANAHCPDVGLLAVGLDNPHPERSIERITLTAAEDGAVWAVLGLSLSDQPAYFPPSPLSYGLPRSWGAAAVVYALVEGLAGVVDAGVAFRRARVSPRWAVANVNDAQVTITYPSSDGYVAYHYHHAPERRVIELTLTGSGDACECHILLPAGVGRPVAVRAGERDVAFTVSERERSRYVDVTLPLPGPHAIAVEYSAP